jgi:hypothetical protein
MIKNILPLTKSLNSLEMATTMLGSRWVCVLCTYTCFKSMSLSSYLLIEYVCRYLVELRDLCTLTLRERYYHHTAVGHRHRETRSAAKHFLYLHRSKISQIARTCNQSLGVTFDTWTTVKKWYEVVKFNNGVRVVRW